MLNYERLGDFLAYHGRLPENKKEYATFVLFKGVKKWKINFMKLGSKI